MATVKHVFFFLTILIASCAREGVELAPDYILRTGEGDPMLNLAYGDNLVPPPMIAFSVQEKYILAKSRRGSNITDYYIVKILPPPVRWKEDLSSGILKQTEFDSMTKALGIDHIEWKSLE